MPPLAGHSAGSNYTHPNFNNQGYPLSRNPPQPQPQHRAYPPTYPAGQYPGTYYGQPAQLSPSHQRVEYPYSQQGYARNQNLSPSRSPLPQAQLQYDSYNPGAGTSFQAYQPNSVSGDYPYYPSGQVGSPALPSPVPAAQYGNFPQHPSPAPAGLSPYPHHHSPAPISPAPPTAGLNTSPSNPGPISPYVPPVQFYPGSINPQDLHLPSTQPTQPSAPLGEAPTVSSSGPKVTLRLNPRRQSAQAAADSPVPEMAPRRSLSVKREAVAFHGGVAERPRRGAGQKAAERVHAQAVDDGDDDEDFGEGDEGMEEEDGVGGDDVGSGSGSLPVAGVDDGQRRSGRDRKPPVLYADQQAQQAAEGDSPPIQRKGKKGLRKAVIDPDEEDEADEGEYGVPSKPRKAFPPRPTAPVVDAGYANGNVTYTNGRQTRSRGAPAPIPPTPSKSRRGSADEAESFHPDDSLDDPDGDADGSDDPLAGEYSEQEESEEEDDDGEAYGRRRTRSRAVASRKAVPVRRPTQGPGTRRSARFGMHDAADDSFTGTGAGGRRTSGNGPKRSLRQRAPVNYQLPPADISVEMMNEADMLRDGIAGVSRPNGASRAGGLGAGGLSGGGAGGLGGGRGGRGGVRFGGGFGGKSGGWGMGGMSGMDLARAMGGEDTSDSDDLMTPLKPSAAAAGSSSAPAGLVGGAKISAPTDVKDFGRINPKSSTADADPLGVNMNVTFDNVGGLDGHIDQLKEMVALPLLYPEVFQQFGITPPRGVLFHGPPGTGKTLLARALAASCSNGNTKISFFMRKGADVLSKWVGEAERQLRMLFEEARAAQPSIIFFDEIDGLAPVRSSKQDQIHASLVSTLLALMDGMDGRGQVILIGATNRPDSVDPALRRPGRFDREFYFPLPNKEARKKIIQINTRVWDPPLEDGLVEMLAGATKGYGGADMRALCTEAALNAIQRRYPQIYKSTDRFELDTKSIQVKAKDFLMSVKKIIPSSARSTTSTAIPLPTHLVPLLSSPLDRLKTAVDNVLPRHKDRTALEEAMYEEDEGDMAGAEILQTLDKMRTYRPRVLVSGTVGMGQTYLGPAILHHLEGFHVQNFDLGILLSDSARTVEAALVQLFIEAKRHQPSILYIPALVAWSNTLTDSAKATFKSLLDGIQPSEPILLLGLAESEGVGEDVRAWFGWDEEGEVELGLPSRDERAEYFAPLITHIQTPPNMWPDALPRRPRVLEQLKIAAPLPPRQPTEAEIAKERERDVNARNMMVLSFTGLVTEFTRKYKRVVASVKDDAFMLHDLRLQQAADQAAADAAEAAPDAEVVEGEWQGVPMVEITAATDAGTPMPNGRAHSLPPNEAGPSNTSDISMSNSQPLPSGSGESSSQPFSTQPLLIPTQASSVLTDLTSSQPPRTFSALLGPPAPLTPMSTQSSQPADIPNPAPSGPKQPDWTPYDIDTDTLSRRLAKHKYHRPADFLADVDKIKSNAEKLDVDRQTKIAELVSHAYLHVAEFDPRWGPEFEAYAERMRVRREKRDAARKSEEEKGKEAEAGDGVDKGKKRAREDGEDDVEMGDEDVPAEKRVRIDDGLPTEKEPTPPTDIPSVPPPAPPAPVYPNFVIPQSKLTDLTQALQGDTDGFTVEELEQLRAGLFGRIWKKRGEWERGELIDELRAFLGKMVRGVKGRSGE